MRKNIFIITILLLFYSCRLVSYIKINNLIQGGNITKPFFNETIPFQFDKNFITIKVKIGNQYEDFLFDTGALTVIDNSLAKKLGLRKIGSQKINDSNGNPSLENYAEISNVNIAGIDFNNIGCAIVDLGSMNQKCCTNVKGIIGYNIINKGIWRIDYLNQKITITDSIDSLKFANDKKVINFYGDKKPKIRIETDSVYIGELLFDTGSSGSISIPNNESENFKKKLPFLKSYGKSSGVFSSIIDTSISVKFPNLVLGRSLNRNNIFVSFTNSNKPGLLGNKFLKDYVVTINWKNQEIILSSYRESKGNPSHTFGFFLTFDKGKLVVNSILENSAAYLQGIQINDQILQINDKNYRNIEYGTFCKLDIDNISNGSDTLFLVIKKGEKEQGFHLQKKDFNELLQNQN